MICNHLAHAAAGTFPKQTGKARYKTTGRSQELWKLLDVGVLSMIKLPAMGKAEGLKIRQVSPAPGQGFFSVGQGGITQGATHRKQSELIMLFSNIKKTPNNKPSCIFSPLLSIILPTSGTKEYVNCIFPQENYLNLNYFPEYCLY